MNLSGIFSGINWFLEEGHQLGDFSVPGGWWAAGIIDSGIRDNPRQQKLGKATYGLITTYGYLVG